MEGHSNGWHEAAWLDVMVDFRCWFVFCGGFLFVFMSLSKGKVASPPFWIVPSEQGNLKLQLGDS